MEKQIRLKTLHQKRANYAWKCIEEVKKVGSKKYKDEYRSYVERAAALIHRNGLGYTLAFYRSRFSKSRAYEALYDHIDGWFRQVFRKDKDILDWIRDDNTTSIDVLRATREILAMLDWLKRFAEAELQEESSS